MTASHLIIIIRTISASKWFSFITIFGLVVGIAGSAIIAQYILYENSYDKFQASADHIYRVAYSVESENQERQSYATTFLPVAPGLKEVFPEIIDFNRILYLDRHAVVSYRDKIFQQDGVIYADPSFYTFFSYPLLKGDPSTALAAPNSVVISESLARKYFEDEDPVGKFIKLNEEFNELNLLVTGIQREIPRNTHLKPSMVVSLKSLEASPLTMANLWKWPIYLNYIRLREGADAGLLNSKLPAYAAQYVQENNMSFKTSFFLQSFSEIHRSSHLQYEIEENGDPATVYLLAVVSVMILIIAYVNFINLLTAKSLSRLREIGVRKILGSGLKQLIGQFFLESAIFNLIAMLATIVLLAAVQDEVSDFLGIPAGTGTLIRYAWIWIVVYLSGTFFSAFYPALVLTRYKPLSALKGVVPAGRLSARKSLVGIQFITTSGLLMISTAIYFQINHIHSLPLGINIGDVLVVNAPRLKEDGNHDSAVGRNDPFKVRILNTPGVKSVSLSSSVPGVWISKSRNVSRSGVNRNADLTYSTLGVDYDFVNTYSMHLLAGRNFTEKSANDQNAVILTEKAAHQLGFRSAQEAIGEAILLNGTSREVIGVVQDYHHLSLHENYEAIIMYPDQDHREYYSIDLEAQSNRQLSEIIQSLENQWKSIFPSNPFEYTFLNESFQAQYNSDMRVARIFRVFCLLSFLLACLGLFGLASFIAMKRTREMAIRKVIGCSTFEILVLMARDVSGIILVSGMIAMPLAYLATVRWLEQFTFRIDLNPWHFILPLLAISLLGLLSVSLVLIKASRANPATILRSE